MGFYQKGPWVASLKKPYHTPDNKDPIIQCGDCPVLMHKDEAMIVNESVMDKWRPMGPLYPGAFTADIKNKKILVCVDCYRKRRATA